MDKIDYRAWANEYKLQSDILTQKIEEKRKMLSDNLTYKERVYTEKSLLMLEEMLDDCTGVMYDLRRMAEKNGEVMC